MRKLNKLIICLIGIFIILSSSYIVKAEDNTFTGTRDLVIEIDESDINSYVSGGREGFELALRKSRPTWLEYTLKTQDKTITFTMNFSFSTYDEYVERLTELLGYKPAIMNEQGDKTNIVEGFKSIELTNFVKNQLEAEDMLVEGNIQEFFTVNNSTLELGEAKYETKEAIDTREKQDVILFSNVSIQTVINNISDYSREITVTIDSDEEDDLKEIKERFEKIGEVKENSKTRVTVSFDANSLEELSEKTMQALNVSVLITEKQEYSTDEKMKITYEESIDNEKLLTENGSISQRITCSEIFENIEKEEDTAVNVNNKVVTLQRKDENMIFTYERPITFENIKISTKITMYGELERKIILQLPLENANYYKDILEEKFKNKLTKGMTLNIYDEGTMRCYSIEFKSLTIDRLEKKTSEIISGKDEFEFENKFIFFLKSNIKEELEVNTIIEGTLQPSQIEVEYILPDSTNKISDQKVDEPIHKIDFVRGNIEFTFTYNNYIVIGLVILGILIVAIIVLIIVKKIKKKLNKKPEEQQETQPQPQTEQETKTEQSEEKKEEEKKNDTKIEEKQEEPKKEEK